MVCTGVCCVPSFSDSSQENVLEMCNSVHAYGTIISVKTFISSFVSNMTEQMANGGIVH